FRPRDLFLSGGRAVRCDQYPARGCGNTSLRPSLDPRTTHGAGKLMRVRSKQGFTLLEMMVALTIGAMAVTSIYTVSAASSRHFFAQQQISQTQNALRMAAERVRRDIERAGFLGSPHSNLNEERLGCIAGMATRIQAIDVLHNEQGAALTDMADNTFIEADELRLTGNYATADEYRGEILTATEIRLQANNQAFRRSFGIIGSGYSQEVFESVFAPGRVLRVVHKG